MYIYICCMCSCVSIIMHMSVYHAHFCIYIYVYISTRWLLFLFGITCVLSVIYWFYRNYIQYYDKNSNDILFPVDLPLTSSLSHTSTSSSVSSSSSSSSHSLDVNNSFLMLDGSNDIFLSYPSNDPSIFIQYTNTTLITDICIITISYFIFFLVGWIFFYRALFRDYEVHILSIQFFFSLVFTLSCSMFELIIFEILGITQHSSRWYNWKINIFSMLILLIFIIPIYIIYYIVKPYDLKFMQRIAAITIAFTAFLGIFYKLGKDNKHGDDRQ